MSELAVMIAVRWRKQSI